MTAQKVTPRASDLAELLAEIPDAVIVLDPLGRVKWGNRAAERLFTRSLAESIGISGIELVHPDDLELVLRSLASVQGKEIGTLIEVRVKTGTGWRLVEVLGTPVTWLGEAVVLFVLRDLTERRRFEVARNEEARLRSVVHNSAAVIILVSATGLVQSVSGALGRLLGHDPELIEHRPLAELARDPDRPLLEAALQRASRGATVAEPVTVVVHLRRHASNQTVPFELTVVNLLDDPTVGGYLVSAHDITARTAAELELHHTLSLLTATLNSTADGILVVGTDGRITSFNGRFAEMWQVPASVLASGDDASAMAYVMGQLTDPDAFEAKVRELYASPEAESHDTLEFKDGRVFERYSRPQRLDGAVVGRVWSFHDVTERHRSEQELRESEQRFRRVFKEGPLPIAVVDLDQRISNVNKALCRFVGRTRQELVGNTLESFTHPDDVDKDIELNWQISAGMVPSYETETRFVTKGGHVVFGKVTASVVRDDNDAVVHGMRIIEDITKRKRLERELVAHASTAGKLLASLTPRETEVLALLGGADTAPQMAKRLSVSVRTVESHLANAYRKLGVRNREDAAAEFARLRSAVAGLQLDIAGSSPGFLT
ncbi:MAG: PAS domain S-box protein [Acidimicrobiales bacterium]|jgi:PAS domain S-box-containing protein